MSVDTRTKFVLFFIENHATFWFLYLELYHKRADLFDYKPSGFIIPVEILDGEK